MIDRSDHTPDTSNAPEELSVSEVAQKLKRVVEGAFSYVRIRGELSRVVIAKSGHMYTDLKDENAVLNAVCWKGTVNNLNLKPEEGLEVVVTGRLTTYPARSNYQIVIESMELAGEGALLKMLEERRKKLAAEGLFDAERKKDIPWLPGKIGVITSPTGAVIRDIMHRLNDRFPRPVYLWPVTVQGETAAREVMAGIDGFNRLPKDSLHRPDVIIVARGGGSLEDLMPFNDEALVRAVAASEIPIISAVGHETDTTLIDYAADLRAPTPTGAAEKAVPVRAELLALVMDDHRRLFKAVQRLVDIQKKHIEALARGLVHPKRLLENIQQRLDHVVLGLDRVQKNMISERVQRLSTSVARLSPKTLQDFVVHQSKQVAQLSARAVKSMSWVVETKTKDVVGLGKLLNSYSFERVLERGFVLVQDKAGKPIPRAAQTKAGQEISLRFFDNTAAATITGRADPVKKTSKKASSSKDNQGELF